MPRTIFSRIIPYALALPVLLATQPAVAQDDLVPLELKSNEYFQVDRVTTVTGQEIIRTIISGPPTSPPGFARQQASVVPGSYGTIKVMEVPAFDWSYGCSATSAAMIAGYYDRNGWDNMYTGPTNGGVMPLNNSAWGTGETPLSATHQGIDGRSEKGHVDDYWISYGSTGPDPWDGNWDEHIKGECTADYMNTNQWVNPDGGWNIDGGTVFYTYGDSAKMQCDDLESWGFPFSTTGDVGLRKFFESREYTVSECFTQRTDAGLLGVAGGFSFSDYKTEIDAGRPVMFHVEGHTMVGIGYDDSDDTMYIHDTWNHEVYTMTWGGSYSGMDMYAVTIVHVDPVDPPTQYTLSVATSGTGSGTVSSTPAGISCGADCSEDYDENTSVTLTPSAAAGSSFTGWSGNCSGTGTCQVTMNAARSVTATFDTDPITQYTLSVATSGTGSGTVSSNPAGINCGSDCTEDYNEGTAVTLTPDASAGSTFTGWSGDCSGTGTCQVTMNAASSVTATFDSDPAPQYILSVSTSGSGSGTVSSDPAGISCGADCSEEYVEDTIVTLTPSAAAGSSFTGWSGDCSGTGTCQVTMDSARNVTASFAIDSSPQYTLSITKSGTGSGSVGSDPAGINCGADCSEDYGEDTTVTLTQSAAADSVFAGWSGNCSGTGACQVTMLAAMNVTATFDLAPPIPQHTLSVNTSGTGSGTITSEPAGISCGADCSEDYDEDTIVTLTPGAAPGSTFTGWSGDCSGIGDCLVTMEDARSATALFTVEMYLERFLSYKARTTSKTPKFEKLTTSLSDQFEGKDFDVRKMESLLNPAAGTIEEIEDMDSHLIGYQIRKIRGDAKHEKQIGVMVINELGTLVVNTKKADSLFIPSATDLDSPVEPLDPVNIDHFKCYSVTVKKKICEDDPTQKCKTDEDCSTGSCNLGFPRGVQREYVDQFDQAKLFDIKKPTKLCTPVDVAGGGIMDEEVSLMCYQAKKARKQPRHVKVQGIYVDNQFGTDQLQPGENWQVDTLKEEEICIPSLLGPIE